MRMTVTLRQMVKLIVQLPSLPSSSVPQLMFHPHDIISWVGFELIRRCYQLGISQRRAEWFTRCTRYEAQSDHVHMTTFEEGLGRVMYVVGASEYECFILTPLCKFMCLHPRASVRRIPAYVCFLLTYPTHWHIGGLLPFLDVTRCTRRLPVTLVFSGKNGPRAPFFF